MRVLRALLAAAAAAWFAWPAGASADDKCDRTDFNPAPHKSGCATIQVSPKIVRPGEKITVTANSGCGGYNIFCSAAQKVVMVDGKKVTATDTDYHKYHGTPISPDSGLAVAVSGGQHSVVFTIKKDAEASCVRGMGSYTGPFCVAGTGLWSSIDGFEITRTSKRFVRVRVQASTDLVRPGDQVDFTITATPSDEASSLTIAAGLPPGSDYVQDSADSGGIASQSEVRWNFEDVDTSTTVKFAVKAKDADALKDLDAFTSVVRATAKIGAQTIRETVDKDLAIAKVRLRFEPSKSDAFGTTHGKVDADGFDTADGKIELLRSTGGGIGGTAVRVLPNQLVDPLQTGSPRMLVTDARGFRIFPGGSNGARDFLVKPELMTDSGGLAQFRVVAGTQPATDFLFETDESAHHEVTAGRFIDLGGDAASFPNSLTLAQKIDAELLDSGSLYLPSGRGSRAQKQDTLLEWFGQLRWSTLRNPSFGPIFDDYEFAPVSTATGRAGIVFYPRGSNPNGLVKYLRGDAGGDAGSAYVLDVDAFEGYGVVLDIDAAGMPSVPAWETAVASKALAGRLTPWPDEDLVYFGWPYPPPNGVASAGQARGFYARTIGGASMSALVHSPVRLLFTDGSSNSLGVDAAGQAVLELPGIVVRGAGSNPEGYVLPVGDYTLGMTGTGTGRATVELLVHGASGNAATVFELQAKKGAKGSLAIDDGTGPAQELTFGGKSYDARAGLRLAVSGVPRKRVRTGRRVKVKVRVKDPFGRAVAAALVKLEIAGFAVQGVTGGTGRCTLALQAPRTFAGGTVSVSAPGFIEYARTFATK